MTLPDWIVLIAYFGVIVLVGTSVGKFTHTTGDFFFGGRRFSWWLVAISCVATLVGSYSFLSYSQSGFNFGLATALPYTNEWFILPLFLLGWLPIIYYNRITSIPEYFERRFDRR
ncbi:MAG: sodium:solute symporter family transporter, partial [Planctomycetota bacterium]